MYFWIYQGGRFLLSLELPLIYRTVLHHHNFRRDIIILLFGDSQKDQAQNIVLAKSVQTFTEGT